MDFQPGLKAARSTSERHPKELIDSGTCSRNKKNRTPHLNQPEDNKTVRNSRHKLPPSIASSRPSSDPETEPETAGWSPVAQPPFSTKNHLLGKSLGSSGHFDRSLKPQKVCLRPHGSPSSGPPPTQRYCKFFGTTKFQRANREVYMKFKTQSWSIGIPENRGHGVITIYR